jgi:hypothetical protein
VIKYKKLRGARYMACMGGMRMRTAFNCLIEKYEAKRPLEKRRNILLESILIRVGGGELIRVV